MWRKIAGLTVLSKKIGLKSGMDRMDSMLKISPFTNEPVAVLAPRCDLGIGELGGGVHPATLKMSSYKWPTRSDGSVTGTKPTDAYNDFIKGSTYLFMNVLGPIDSEPRRRKTVRSSSIKDRLKKQGII